MKQKKELNPIKKNSIAFILYFILFNLSFHVSLSQNLNLGVQAYWNFDNNLIGSLNGFIGYSKNTTFLNDSINNEAIAFNGKNSSLEISNGLDLYDHFTISFWFKSFDLSHKQTIINQLGSENGHLFHLNIEDSSLVLNIVDDFGKQNTIYGPSHLRNYRWYFVSVIIKGSFCYFYLNDMLSVDKAELDINIRKEQSQDKLIIGADVNYLNNFNGLLDEFIIYNRALDMSEVKLLFNKNFPNKIIPFINNESFNIGGRATYISDSITTNNPEIIINFWDDQLPDGDNISIYLNDSLLVKDYTLLKTKKTVKFKILPLIPYYLIVYANNEGSLPPNTAAVEAIVGRKRYPLMLVSSLSKNCSLKFTYIPDNK